MTRYQVTAVSARLSTGVLELTKAQAKDRRHCLAHLKGDSYRIVAPVEFKSGEVFGYDGELPKALGDVLEVEGKPSGKKLPKAKPTAAAPADEASGD